MAICWNWSARACGRITRKESYDNLLAHEYSTWVYSNRDSEAHGCDTEMEKLLAIGGVFLRARDPLALGRCYQEYLGLPLTPT